jgi:hypothetical protein
VISWSQDLYLYVYTNTEKRARAHTLNIHAMSGIRTQDPGFRVSEDSARLRSLGYRDRQLIRIEMQKEETGLSAYVLYESSDKRNKGSNEISTITFTILEFNISIHFFNRLKPSGH